MRNVLLSCFCAFVLSACGLGVSTSTVRRDPSSGQVTSLTHTTSLGVTEPAKVASVGEVANANATMVSVDMQKQYFTACMEYAKTNNLPPGYCGGYAYGANSLMFGGQFYSPSGMMLGVPGGVVGTYTASGAAVSEQVRRAMGLDPLNITVIAAPPVAETEPAPPPAPPPPYFSGGNGSVPRFVSPPRAPSSGASAAPVACLNADTASELANHKDRVSELLDAAADVDQTAVRDLIVETERTLRSAEAECRENPRALSSFTDFRRDIAALRRSLRRAGTVAAPPPVEELPSSPIESDEDATDDEISP